jgi:SAM-dependent methyltransferase
MTAVSARPLIPVPCILCKVEGTPTDIAENGFALRRCPSCGLLFVSPRPEDDDIQAIYEHDAAHTAARQILAKSRDPEAVAHARHTLRLLRPYQPGGDLLEIGAGAGIFLNEARRAGYRIAAIEPNPLQASFMKETFGIDCVAAPFKPETLGNAAFDVVYHCNVLSHFSNPVEALALIRRHLRPGGVLVMETGNFADVHPRFHPLIVRTERFQLPDHLFFFGHRSLRLLLEQTGFTLRALHRHSRVAEKVALPLLRKMRLGRVAGRLGFFLTYRLGRRLPKSGRPQTVIVIASTT